MGSKSAYLERNEQNNGSQEGGGWCASTPGPFGKLWGHFGATGMGEGCRWEAMHRTVPLGRRAVLDSFLFVLGVCHSPVGGKPVNLSLEPNSILRINVKCVNTELPSGAAAGSTGRWRLAWWGLDRLFSNS